MDLESRAIHRIRLAAELSEAYYQKPLLLAYSGGKDSEVCLELCRRARVPLEVIHNLTTADAPETIYHVRKVFRQLELEGIVCAFHKPLYHGKPTSMWSLIVQKGLPPTRKQRYCCQILKEGSSTHRAVVLGVRAAESQNRKDSAVAERWGSSRREVQRFDFDNGDERIVAPCQQKAEIKIHPIVDWNDSDVWAFLRDAKVERNPVYSLGFQRVGCVGCPMAGKVRYREFRVWPAFEQLYRTAFDKMLRRRWEAGKFNSWNSADDVFRWWMEDRNVTGQLDIFGGEVGQPN